MRRPLVFCGLLFSLLLLLFLQIHPLWWTKEQRLPEETVRFEGDLYEKEYRMQAGEPVLVLYLKNIAVYDVMPYSDGGAEASLPHEIPYKLMCYMKRGEGGSGFLGWGVSGYSGGGVAASEAAGGGGEAVSETAGGEGALRLGSRVLLRGKVRHFREAANDGEFDSAKYYQILGIGASVRDCTVLEQSGAGSALKNRLYDIKEYAGLLIHAALDEEDASVMGSLLLGESALLDREVKDLYKRSGIIHILAISGLHISLLGMGIFRLMKKCCIPTALSTAAASAVVVLFGLMTGFGPSSMRAVIMFLLQMTSCLIGRTYDLPTGLCTAAILVMGMQPLYLYHSGFMLSFLSVASLAVLQPVFNEAVPKAAAPGLAILIGTLPVHAWYYYEEAPYAVLLNLLVLPCMPVLMVLGGSLLLFGGLWLPLADIPAKCIHILLQFYRLAGAFSLRLPGHRWVIGKPAVYQVLLYLTTLVICVVLWEKMSKMWSRMMFCLAVLVLVSDMRMGLQVMALDVGQGDCLYVTDHRGVHMLIDGGSSSKKQAGEYQIEPALKYHGADRLNAVFISHLDSDHYNGILELIELSDEGGAAIGRIFVSEAVAAGGGVAGAAPGTSGVVADGTASDAALSGGDSSGVASSETAPDGVVAGGGSGGDASAGGSGEVGPTSADGIGTAGSGSASAGGKYAELSSLAALHGIPVEVMPQGSIYRSGRLELTCLYPSARSLRGGADETNENSMVLYLKYGSFTALFTGDLEGSGESAVAETYKALAGTRPLTLLKVAHHGSKNATSSALLEVLQPKIALISAGADNSYGHPHAETLSRLEEAGARVFRTDVCGEITVSVYGSRVEVETYAE